MTLTLESVLTAPKAFGLPASPLQRAICRIIDGTPLGDLADRDDVRASLGCDPAQLPTTAPRELLWLAGIRCGKSMMAAANCIAASQSVDLSQLAHGEVARVSVVSLGLDQARAVLEHLHGQLTAKPALRQLLIGDPVADGCTLRHPSGRPVEVRVVAASRAGGTLVARWSAGVVFDEAPRMSGSDAVVNLADMRSAVLGRLLPGAQLISIGSPWSPEGWAHGTFTDRFGKPGPDLVVIRARADALNPSYWTPARVERFKRDHPRVHSTDVLAEFGVSENAAFDYAGVNRCFESRDLTRYRPGKPVLAVDPSSLRGDSFVGAIARTWHWNGERMPMFEVSASGSHAVLRDELGRIRWEPPPEAATLVAVSEIHSWDGRQLGAIRMDGIVDELADVAKRAGAKLVVSDQREDASLEALFRRRGLRFQSYHWSNASKAEAVTLLRRMMAEKSLVICHDSETKAQLHNYAEHRTKTGFSYRGRGRHDDRAAVLLTLAHAIDDGALPGAETNTPRIRHEWNGRQFG